MAVSFSRRAFTRCPPSLLLAVMLPGCTRAEPPAIEWRTIVEIATGRGERGPWRQNESAYDHVDDGTVALDETGNAAVAWVDQGRKDVFFQILAPDGTTRFPEPVKVSRTPGVFSWQPRIVWSGRDRAHVYVLWQEIVFSGGSHGGDMFVASSRDGGARFEPALNLSRSVNGDGKGRINRDHWQNGSFDLAQSFQGTLIAAWTDYEGSLWLARSTDDGKSFTDPRRVRGTAPHPARAPSLAAGLDGIVYLAWTVGEDPAADVRIARSFDEGGSFTDPVILRRTAGYSDAPRLAIDGVGTLHVVFSESEGGPFAASRILHARSADGGRTFSEPTLISEPPRDDRSASFPGIAVCDRDVVVYWELCTRGRENPRGLGFARSSDGGATFTRPAVVPGSIDPAGGFNGSHQGLLMKKLALNSRGDLALVNSSLKVGAQSRVWLLRGESLVTGRPSQP